MDTTGTEVEADSERGTEKRTYETKRKGANRTGLGVEKRWHKIRLSDFVSVVCVSGCDDDGFYISYFTTQYKLTAPMPQRNKVTHDLPVLSFWPALGVNS
jgi:hypothetical protein